MFEQSSTFTTKYIFSKVRRNVRGFPLSVSRAAAADGGQPVLSSRFNSCSIQFSVLQFWDNFKAQHHHSGLKTRACQLLTPFDVEPDTPTTPNFVVLLILWYLLHSGTPLLPTLNSFDVEPDTLTTPNFAVFITLQDTLNPTVRQLLILRYLLHCRTP
ncbi:hypothetical protein SLA2020_142210 [Shorea laevis]